jgi:tripartite-type tricarboxylate transporter receptor subunit TctC
MKCVPERPEAAAGRGWELRKNNNTSRTREEAMRGRPFIRTGLVPAIAMLWVLTAHAQDFPNRQITIVVGVAPGGITDVSTRIYADVVSRNIGQKIIIENRPAGGGSVAAATVQNAPPDGYTLLTVVGAQFSSQPAMQPAPYDPIKGFAPVTLLFRLPALLLVPADSPARSVAELLDLGRTKLGGLSFGSPGAGSPGHLMAAKISLATKTPMQFVHYRGGAPLMADLITGRVDFTFASYTASRSNLEGGKLKALTVDAEKRLPALPNLPTVFEVGLGQYRVADWFGLAAPAATPTAVVQKLNAEFDKASRDPDLVRRLTENGTLIATSTPEQMAVLLAKEVKDLGELVKTLGLGPQ